MGEGNKKWAVVCLQAPVDVLCAETTRSQTRQPAYTNTRAPYPNSYWVGEEAATVHPVLAVGLSFLHSAELSLAWLMLWKCKTCVWEKEKCRPSGKQKRKSHLSSFWVLRKRLFYQRSSRPKGASRGPFRWLPHLGLTRSWGPAQLLSSGSWAPVSIL